MDKVNSHCTEIWLAIYKQESLLLDPLFYYSTIIAIGLGSYSYVDAVASAS